MFIQTGLTAVQAHHWFRTGADKLRPRMGRNYMKPCFLLFPRFPLGVGIAHSLATLTFGAAYSSCTLSQPFCKDEWT